VRFLRAQEFWKRRARKERASGGRSARRVEGAVPYRAVGLAVLGCHLFSAVATARWLTRRHRFAVRNRAEQDQSKTRASKHHKLSSFSHRPKFIHSARLCLTWPPSGRAPRLLRSDAPPPPCKYVDPGDVQSDPKGPWTHLWQLCLCDCRLPQGSILFDDPSLYSQAAAWRVHDPHARWPYHTQSPSYHACDRAMQSN
jgi:hypothetical protein